MKKQQTYQERVAAFAKEYEALFKKYNLALRFSITFPNHKNIPWLAKIGLKFIARYGATIDIRFQERLEKHG